MRKVSHESARPSSEFFSRPPIRLRFLDLYHSFNNGHRLAV